MTSKPRTWFITGASKGIGAELVKAVLASGDNVVATARDTTSLVSNFGDNPHLLPLTLDVTKGQQIRETVEAAVSRFGTLDVLVNNAGYGHLGLFEETTEAEMRQQFETNLFGLMEVTRAVLPVMRQFKSGRIFNISSIAGIRGNYGASLYCATKFAIEGFTQTLAQEVAPLGIKVTCVSPGAFRTDFLDPSSVKFSTSKFPEYKAGVETLTKFMERNHTQPGDPFKLALAIVQISNLEDQPRSFVAGTDAYNAANVAYNERLANLEKFKDLSTGLDGQWK